MPKTPGRYSLRARYVFPVDAPPIHDGIVTIDQGRIREIGRGAAGDGPFIDLDINLGNVAILPGFVNAHCHLDFSNLKGPLGRSGMPLPEWLELVIRQRREASPANELTKSKAAIAAGHAESLAQGVTTLGNIARDARAATGPPGEGIDYTSFLELIGLSAARADPARNELAAWLASSGGLHDRWQPGISPHAPYSVHRSLIAEACRLSAERRLPVAMHLAESPDELELLAHGSGPFVEMLRRIEAWDPTAFEPGLRPLDYLNLLAGAHRALVIHGNYLDAEERAFVAQHAGRIAVVYCPRTHSYFGHARYPLAELLSAGANVALGTDGRGSNPDLSLLAEMQHAAELHPEVPPAAILRLGTLGGAEALGRANRVGSLTPGKDANLAILGLPNRDEPDPHRLLLDREAHVVATIYRGRVLQGHVTGINA